MLPVNLRTFRNQVKLHKRRLKGFLTRLEKNPPKQLDKMAAEIETEVWKEVDCLTCANCCKKMTPTFTTTDIKRISAHFDMTPVAFKDKWLKYDKKDKDWRNKKQPCQFLNLADHKCSIYEIRPLDCSGFPHLSKSKMVDYMHVHKQNIEYCPATFKMVEKMQVAVKGAVSW